MKYPILYKKNETDFFTLGQGVLTNVIKSEVTEERNGSFFLEMRVLTDTEQYKLIELDSLIKVDASVSLKDQRFRVKRIIENHDGTAEVYAEHISYLTQELSLKPRVLLKGTGVSALNQWANAIIDDHPFITSSTVNTESSTSFEIGDVDNAREALGGVQGSILDKWGGEYLFDNYHISLKEKRGTTANTLIAYGRNITDFEQEQNIMNTFTSVFPYARYTDDNQVEHLVTLPDYIVDSKYVGNYPNRKALPVDFSSEFEDKNIPTPAKLKTLAERYIKDNEVGIPKTSVKVSFLDLSQTLDYEDIAKLEQLSLCDDVRVEYPKLGVSVVSKVVKTVYDTLSERYVSIEIGAKRTTLGTTIKEQNDTIKEIEKNSNNAQLSADGKNMIFYGLFGENGLGEPTATKVGDLWYKPNGEYTIMYVWNGTVWEQVLNTEEEAIIKDELEQMDKDVQEAKDKADEVAVSLGDIVGKLDDIEYDVDGLASKVTINSDEISGLVTKTDGHSTQLANLTIEADRISSQVVDLQNEEIGTNNLLRNSDFNPKEYGDWVTDKGVKFERTDVPAGSNALTPIKKMGVARFIGGSSEGGLLKQEVLRGFSVADKIYSLSFYHARGSNLSTSFIVYLNFRKGGRTIERVGKRVSITASDVFERYTETFKTSATDFDNIELVYEFPSGQQNTGRILYLQAPILAVGSKTGNWGQGNATTYSQITQLSDDILLRVQKGDVINQINISTEGILIDGAKTHITGQTTIDNAVIKDAMIDSLTASKLTAGTIDANKINVINLNANNIATGTLNGIYINLDKTMTIAENGSINSSYFYGDDYAGSYNPRWFDGTSRYGNRYLNFLSNVYKVNSNNTKGSFLYYTEAFYGPDMVKLRQYNNTNTSLDPRSHLDITANHLLAGKGWDTNISIEFDNGHIYASDSLLTSEVKAQVGLFSSGIEVRDVREFGLETGRINALNNYNTLKFNNKRTDLGDLELSKDSSGRRIQSYAVYSRTYGGGATVTVTDAGTLGRITSAAKYKLDIEDADGVMGKAFKVLEINPRMWFDKTEVESIAKAMTNGNLKELEADRKIRRHHGFVADEFHEKGLDEVVIYDSKGEIEGLSYDRISMYHNVILKQQQKEIELLKQEIAVMKGGV